jgi:hypothetical protein
MLKEKKVRLPKNIRIICSFSTDIFDKVKFREIISRNEELESYLIPTINFDDIKNIIEFVNENKKVVLKDKVTNCRNEMCFIEKEDQYYKVTDYRKSLIIHGIIKDEEELKAFLIREHEASEHCIVEKNIMPAKVDKTIYDLMITMKKQKYSSWIMYSMECKVGGNDFIITHKSNERFIALVARVLEKALPIGCNYRRIYNEINDVCICLCIDIEKIENDLEQININIAMDEDTRLWILDISRTCNVKAFNMFSYNIGSIGKHNLLLYAPCLSIL